MVKEWVAMRVGFLLVLACIPLIWIYPEIRLTLLLARGLGRGAEIGAIAVAGTFSNWSS